MSEDQFYQLSKKEKEEIFSQVSQHSNLPTHAVEKDWWVAKTLSVIFGMELAPHLIFKGGTSLSKVWKVIERLSEDIDLAMDRKFLGFDGDLSKTQVRKLRIKSFQHISEVFFPALKEEFANAKLDDVDITLGETKDSDQDPLLIEIYYPTVYKSGEYLKPRVLVELGSRSLREPFTLRSIASLIGEVYEGKAFADLPIEISTLNAERTLLEKIFLIHEEFQKDLKKIRVDRLSRHLYDIDKLMKSSFGKEAFKNDELYKEIVKHRSTITAIRGVDYSLHQPAFINLIPPSDILNLWERDYRTMQEEMIYGESMAFQDLIESIRDINSKINQLDWEI